LGCPRGSSRWRWTMELVSAIREMCDHAYMSRADPLLLPCCAGGTLSSISRIELMQKLARTDKPADLPDHNTFVLSAGLASLTARSLLTWHETVLCSFRPHIPLATTRNVYAALRQTPSLPLCPC
jgi:hypothetical protein